MTSVTSISGASDRIGERPNIFQLVKRRFRGQYAVDRFGADPVLVDITSNLAGLFVRVAVHGGEHLPEPRPGSHYRQPQPGHCSNGLGHRGAFRRESSAAGGWRSEHADRERHR